MNQLLATATGTLALFVTLAMAIVWISESRRLGVPLFPLDEDDQPSTILSAQVIQELVPSTKGTASGDVVPTRTANLATKTERVNVSSDASQKLTVRVKIKEHSEVRSASIPYETYDVSDPSRTAPVPFVLGYASHESAKSVGKVMAAYFEDLAAQAERLDTFGGLIAPMVVDSAMSAHVRIKSLGLAGIGYMPGDENASLSWFQLVDAAQVEQSA